MAGRVLAGYVELRPNISKVTARAVEFVDGSVLDDVDVIIMGTGEQMLALYSIQEKHKNS